MIGFGARRQDGGMAHWQLRLFRLVVVGAGLLFILVALVATGPSVVEIPHGALADGDEHEHRHNHERKASAERPADAAGTGPRVVVPARTMPPPTAAPPVAATEAPAAVAAAGPRVPLMYLTATSSNHFRWLVKLIETVKQHDPTVPYRIVDLGLSPVELDLLATVDGVTVQPFEFSKYPSYFNVAVSAGEYAFKPIAIRDALEAADAVVWMDSSDVLNEGMSRHLNEIHTMGFFSSISSGSLQDWTHPGMFAYYNVGPQDPMRHETNCNAAFLVFSREATLESLVKPWVECALTKACIAPEGSSRANHRQDQAALSILVQRSRGRFHCSWGRFAGLHNIHQEEKGFFDLRTVHGIGKPTSPQSMARLRDRLGRRLALASAEVAAGWARLLEATAVPALPALPTLPASAPLSALDLLGDAYAHLPMQPVPHIVFLRARPSSASILTDALCVRYLLSLLGTSGVVVAVGGSPLAELLRATPALGLLEWEVPPEKDNKFAAALSGALSATPDPATTVLWPIHRLIPNEGPALVHVSAPSLASAWPAQVAFSHRLPGMGAVVTVGGPADGVAPASHLAEMLGKGWTTGHETLMAWLTMAESAADAGDGCVGVWGADTLAKFKEAAAPNRLQLAAHPVGVGTAKGGCLLLAATASVRLPASYNWNV